MIRAFYKTMRGFLHARRDESGSATVEFVVLFPFMVGLLCSGAESGTIMLRQVMLDRGVDIAVRTVRINNYSSISADQLRTWICGASVAIPDCTTNLTIEMTQIARGDALPSIAVPCKSSSGTDNVVVGYENEMMLIRACISIKPLFPGAGLGVDMIANSKTGMYDLVSASAFVVEPK